MAEDRISPTGLGSHLVLAEGTTNKHHINWGKPFALLNHLYDGHHCRFHGCKKGNKDRCWKNGHLVLCDICAFPIDASKGCDFHFLSKGYNIIQHMEMRTKLNGDAALVAKWIQAMKSHRIVYTGDESTIYEDIAEWTLNEREKAAEGELAKAAANEASKKAFAAEQKQSRAWSSKVPKALRKESKAPKKRKPS